MLTPRENLKLFGHEKARESFLTSFHSARFAHAWIVAGPFGIGKATFAFHMARYILSGRQNRNTQFSETDAFHRRIVAQSHGNLWTLGGEETPEIGVESIRDLNGFLNKTLGDGDWRVVLIDGADKLNRNAANALLKRLEEPPPQTVFFLITSLSGCLLPTIRSRCQLLTLSSLQENEVQEVLLAQNLSSPDFLSLAQGSPVRLIRLMEGKGVEIYHKLQEVLQGQAPTSLIYTYGGEEASYTLIEDLLRNYLHRHLLEKIEDRPSFFKELSLDSVLTVYGKIETLFDQCRIAQLDRKATLTSVFAALEKRNEL